MTLKFRKVQRKVLSGDDKDKVKTYAMARSSNYCDMDKLCELISSRSAMSSADEGDTRFIELGDEPGASFG